MATTPIVSVILPMYNSERYIKSCIQSVREQTLKNFELICVDDCSTDKTVEIVSQLAKEDKRIKIVKRKNNSGTAGIPRNIGLRLSCGKYIAFIDSDDLYTKTALEELTNLANQYNADVVHTEQIYMPEENVINVTEQTKMKKFSKENVEFCLQPILETNNLKERIEKFSTGKLFGWVHNKLYQRNFLAANNIYFNNLLTSEDIIFYFKVICTAKRIIRVPNITYIYRYNPDSITRKLVSLETSIHALTHLMIEGTKIMNEFMDNFELFHKEIHYRLWPIDYIIQEHLLWTQRFYNMYNVSQLDPFIKNELIQYCNKDQLPFFSYLYHLVHIYRKKLEETNNELTALKQKKKA